MAVCIPGKYKSEYIEKVGRYLKSYLKDVNNPTYALKILERDIANKGEVEVLELVHSAIVSELGNDISNHFYSVGDIELPQKAQIPKMFAKGGESLIAELEEANNIEAEDDFLEDLDLVPNLDGGKIKDLGIFNSHFYAGVGDVLSKPELAKVFKLASDSKDFDSFFNAIDKKYDIGDDLIRKRHLKKAYVAQKNSIKREDRLVFQWLNYDDSVKIDNYEEDLSKAIIENKSGTLAKHRLVSEIPWDLRNNNQRGERESTNFIDESSAKVRGVKLSDATAYFKLSDIGVLKKRADGGWWFELRHHVVDENEIQRIEYQFANLKLNGNDTPYVITAMTPGDTGNIVLSRVQEGHIEDLFPRSIISAALKKVGLDRTASDLDALPQGKSIASWYRNIENAINEEKRLLKVTVDGKSEAEIRYGKDFAKRYAALANRFANIDNIVRVVGVKRLKDYFQPQVNKNITEEQFNMIIDGAINGSARNGLFNEYVSFPFHASGIIAKHEWLQAARGDDYMLAQDGNSYHLFNRMKLTMTKGLVPDDQSDTRHMIYDQDNVDFYYNGEKYEAIQDIPGLGATNIHDGASFGSSSYIRRLSEAIGVYPLTKKEHDVKQIKNVYSENTLDEKGKSLGYIEKKHALHEAPVGLEIWTKGSKEKGNNAGLIAQILKEQGQVRIYNNSGTTVDELSDIDAVKTFTGKYDVKKGQPFREFSLNYKSNRINKLPNVKSKDTVFGPTQYLSSLNYNMEGFDKDIQDDFNSYSEAFTNMLLDQADVYIDSFIKASEDPDALRALMRYAYSQRGEAKDAVRNKLTITNGRGIHHPDHMSVLRQFILNTMIMKGSMQSRTFLSKLNPRLKNVNFGSSYILSPGDFVKDDKHVILSSSNQVIYNKIKSMSGKKTVPEVNEWLKSNPQKVITYRAPVLNITSIESRTIQEFKEDAGEAIYHHPNDVAIRLIGDYDIDEAGVMLIPDEYISAIEGFQETLWFKNQKINANLDYFDKIPDRLTNAANVNYSRNTMMDIIRGINTQGMATNMKSTASTLSMRFNSITFNDGVVVRPKKLTDEVIMDYAPVALDKVPQGMKTVQKKGKHYIKTTFAHEALLVVNAATDHANKKLKGMLVNKWGARNPLWFTERMFHVEGNLTDKHLKILKDLSNEYKYSSVKRLRTNKTGKRMNSFLANSVINRIYNRITSPINDQKEYLISTFKQGDNANDLKIDILDMNQVVTPEEKLVTRLAKRLEERYDDLNVRPYGYSKERYELAHHETKFQLWEEVKNDPSYTAEQIKVGYASATKFSNEFYKNFKGVDKMTEDNADDAVKAKRTEYDEALFELAKKTQRDLNLLVKKHGENVRKIHAIAFMSGLGRVKNVRYLPPVEALDATVYNNYMRKWERNFFKTKTVKDNYGRDLELLAYEADKDKIPGYKKENFPVLEWIESRKKRGC